MSDATKPKPFGTEFSAKMVIAHFVNDEWSDAEIKPVENLSLHPGAHVFHYSSECFEGLKAYRWEDGTTRIFRLDKHAARMTRSTEVLHLPFPGEDFFKKAVSDLVAENRNSIPDAPGALYIRPAIIGTEVNIGAAGTGSAEAIFFILNSPVGAYFSGDRALRILVEEDGMRAVPGFGSVKAGGNYAAALSHVIRARNEHQADQVLFCPEGDVQETGASNFMLINDEEIITKPLDDTFLHGVTRDSVLTLAKSLGYRVTERNFRADEIFSWIESGGEAALSGTAAVLAGVGTFIRGGEEFHAGGEGEAVGPNTKKIREALTAIQQGQAEDQFGWTTVV